MTGNTHKNYALIIGNLVSVCARHGMKTSQIMKQLKRLEMYDDLLSSYRAVGKTEADIREGVEKGLALRRLLGKAA